MKSMEDLKKDLLNALRQSEKDNKLEGTPLPEDPEQILLGKPISTRDFSKGWIDLYEEVDSSTGKPTGGRIDPLPNSLRGLGIKDNAILAFKFGSTRKKPEEMNDENSEIASDEQWNVVMPSYNDGDDGD